ncbi:MAG: hypothetical protein N4A65_10455 [Cohaesibacter sp.]|jgi:hypothetical protein|nr:hypothetical protein [Cohaesibacter sp.]
MSNKTQSPSGKDEKQLEAERLLARVEREGEALGTSSFARTANKAKDHLGASDIDANDPIEVWGTRIGRIGGAIFAIILVLWLINHFTR